MEKFESIFRVLGAFFSSDIGRLILSLSIILFSIVMRKVISFILLRAISPLMRRISPDIDKFFIRASGGPMSFIILVIGIYFALRYFGLKDGILNRFAISAFTIAFGWLSNNFLVEFEPRIFGFNKRDFSRGASSFILKILRFFIFVVVFLTVLDIWGVNVGAIVASLGLGGLAVALAAKDTAANFISGLIILIDKPFLVGETVKIGDIVGVVEEIGLRATRIRTFDKTLVTIPNQNIVNANIDNLTRRKKWRVKMYISLSYSTKREQIEKIISDIKNMLSEHKGVAKDENIVVCFEEFGQNSLNIFIQYYTNTSEFMDYLAVREDINLKIMHIVEKHGASFAAVQTNPPSSDF